MIEEIVTSTLILVLGYAYPALQCFKAVERNRVDIHELRFWCQYWIIVAVITVVERIGDVFISWLPMYGEMKLALFIYLWYPKIQGTGYVYEKLLRPFVYKNGTDIDRSLVEFRERAWRFAIYYWNNCTELGSNKVLEFLQFVSSESANHGSDEGRRHTSSSSLYRNQTPKPESVIQVQLPNQTRSIRPEDVLVPDPGFNGGSLDEKLQDGQVQSLRHRLRRLIGGK